MENKYSEKLWEKFVKKYPLSFLNEELSLVSQQQQIQSGITDLVFRDQNNVITIVELQINALDRTHFAKSLEYRHDWLKAGETHVRVILLCNEVSERRKDYIDMHIDSGLPLKLIVMSKEEVIKKIEELDPEIIISTSSKENIVRNYDRRNISMEEHKLYIEFEKEQFELEHRKEIESYKHNEYEILTTLFEIIDESIPTKEGDAESLFYKFLSFEKSINSRDFLIWENNFTDYIINLADRNKIQYSVYGNEIVSNSTDDIIDTNLIKNNVWEERAFCPLCREGFNEPYRGTIGYKLPNGLKNHLTGKGSRHYLCSIMRIINNHTRSFRNNLREREREKEALIKQHRLKNEYIFLIGPSEPQLIDNNKMFYKNRTSRQNFKFSDERLTNLSFEIKENKKIMSYTLENDKYIIYADPRPPDKIEFDVYKKPLPKKTENRNKYLLGSFSISDRLKNNLKDKFLERLNPLLDRI